MVVKSNLFLSSKKVNSPEINYSNKNINDNILKIINSLKELGYEKNIDQFDFSINRKEWILDLFTNDNSNYKNTVKFLLNDFSDLMNTRMRTNEKYALCMVGESFVLLCHSIYGEQTISKNWKVIDRVLDKDNVIRFVYFYKKEDNFSVIYYEKNPSEFFANWLGINPKEAFKYLGGKNKICGEIRGIPISFEITDEIFEKKFFNEKIFEIKDNIIKFNEPIEEFCFSLIKSGNKKYQVIDDFIQDLLIRKYDLEYYTNMYSKLNSKMERYITKIIDDEFDLKKEGKIIFNKKHDFYILFINEYIEIRESFLAKIQNDLLNKENKRIFHAGMKFYTPTLKINNLEFYNELNHSSVDPILNYLNDLSISDSTSKIILSMVFKILEFDNPNVPLKYLFHKLSDRLSHEKISNRIINGENDIIELKARAFVENKTFDEEICSDIIKKLKINNKKLYLLGYDELARRIEPITSNHFKDERLKNLKNKIKNKINCKIEFIKVEYGATGCVLILYVEMV